MGALKIPASPEYRRAQARSRAAHKRQHQKWLNDPVAQANHKIAQQQHLEMVKVKRRMEASGQIKELSIKIKWLIAQCRKPNPRPALVVLFKKKINDLWLIRCQAHETIRELDNSTSGEHNKTEVN